MPTISPGDNWQTAVDANPNGTVFTVASGTHTGCTNVVPKTGQQFLPTTPYPQANHPILDGGGSALSAFKHAASGTQPDSVVLKGLEVKNYAPGSQDAAIRGSTNAGTLVVTNWTVEDCYVHDNLNIGLRLGHGMRVTRGRYSNNETLGLGGVGDNAIVDGPEIDNNNPSQTDPGFERGGTKFVLTNGLMVKNVYCHDNYGPGLWADIANRSFTFQDNLCQDNLREGIVIEISYDGIIRRNRIIRSGLDDTRAPAWPWGAGIGIHSSGKGGLEVYENRIIGCAYVISLIQQFRGTNYGGEPPQIDPDMYVRDVNVHHNVGVLLTVPGHSNAGSLGATQAVDDTLRDTVYDPAYNNTINNNRYYYERVIASPFAWSNSYRTYSAWTGFGLDATSKYIQLNGIYVPREVA